MGSLSALLVAAIEDAEGGTFERLAVRRFERGEDRETKADKARGDFRCAVRIYVSAAAAAFVVLIKGGI